MKKLFSLILILILCSLCFSADDPNLVLYLPFDSNAINNVVPNETNITMRYKAFLSVSLNNDGDYNDIQTAINAGWALNPTATRRVLIVIDKGTYDINDVNTSGRGAPYLQMYSYVDLYVVSNGTVKIVNDANNAATANYSLIKLPSDTFTLSNDDTNLLPTNFFINLNMEANWPNTLSNVIGGNRTGGADGHYRHFIFENCTVRAYQAAFIMSLGDSNMVLWIYDSNINSTVDGITLSVIGNTANIYNTNLTSSRNDNSLRTSCLATNNSASIINAADCNIVGFSNPIGDSNAALVNTVIANTVGGTITLNRCVVRGDANTTGSKAGNCLIRLAGTGATKYVNLNSCIIDQNNTFTVPTSSPNDIIRAGGTLSIDTGTDYNSTKVSGTIVLTGTLTDLSGIDANHPTAINFGHFDSNDSNTHGHYVAGKVGGAYSFDGQGDDVNSDRFLQSTLRNSLTVNWWVKFGVGATNFTRLWGVDKGLGGGDTDRWFYFTHTTGGVTGCTYGVNQAAADNDNPLNVYLANNLASGALDWMMLTIVINKISETQAQMFIYKNGVLDNSSAVTDVNMSQYDDSLSFVVGAANHGSLGIRNFFDGAIDDFRIYNRVLSSNEIRALAGLGRKGQWLGDWNWLGD